MARDVVWLLSDGCRRSSYGAGSYAAEAVVGCRVSEAPCNDINLDGPHGSDTSSLEPAGDPGTEIQKFDPELVDSSADLSRTKLTVLHVYELSEKSPSPASSSFLSLTSSPSTSRFS
ncbi:unnamed protein product [Symbiodinium microadriaticum]|nr:unnamed protein product [Symbiodinium microadriaticum]